MNHLSYHCWNALGIIHSAFFGALLVMGGAQALAEGALVAPASRQQLLDQAERCRRILRTSLIDFYLPACVDVTNGGYLESLRNGKFAPTGEKFLTLQARQLWFFSVLASEGYEKEKALAAAKSGYTFIQTKMLDRDRGGYYSKVTDDGAPKDTRKHAYLNSFALYALAAYYRVSQDTLALEAAKNLFRTLDQEAHDRDYGGYIEFFSKEWKPITDPKASGYVGAIGQKTYNTHLHLLESFAELYRAWPDSLVARRLQELIAVNTTTVRFPKIESNVDAYQADWQVVRESRNLRASYGHDVECVWLTLDAVRALGGSPAVYRNWAEALCQSSIDLGYDQRHGGFYSSGPLGKPADDTKKVWWVEAEALVSMLDMYTLTASHTFYNLFSQTLDFVEQHQVAKEGSWWATLAADGAATTDQQRTGPWQGGYHAGRAMIFCAKRLDELAKRADR